MLFRKGTEWFVLAMLCARTFTIVEGICHRALRWQALTMKFDFKVRCAPKGFFVGPKPSSE